MCLQADRNSAYYATYSATSLEDALRYENENGKQVLELVHFTYFQLNLSTVECRSTALNIFVSLFFFNLIKESIPGAKKFVEGVGHHGQFQSPGGKSNI